ncbi:MAG: L,D-transpeptidase [Bdellovibrionales bacterium]|nr:L,D-transpeptidase [Bdellovibrionales bacterium]
MKALGYLALLTLTASIASAEVTQGGLWNEVFGGSPSTLRVVVDRTPNRQTLSVYRGENSEPLRFKISTGREEFELPTSPLVNPYCSFTPTGNVFTPQRLVPNHISNTWEDAEMPNSVFFRGGVALHGTTTPEGNRALGTQASGGCVRLSVADSKTVFDLIQSHGVTDARRRTTYNNVSIEVIDQRPPEEIQKLEKQCNDTRRFWDENCKQELTEWRGRCKSTYEAEMPVLRTCLKQRRDDPRQQNPETPTACVKTPELDSCLKEFISHRNRCKAAITQWQRANSNRTEINNTPPPAQEVRAPLPPSRPAELSQQAPAARAASPSAMPLPVSRPLNLIPQGVPSSTPRPQARPAEAPPRPPADVPHVDARRPQPPRPRETRPQSSDLWMDTVSN